MIATHVSPCRHLDEPASASPRLPEHWLASHPASTRTPAPHTPDEIDALVTLLSAAEASSISIGHGRHATSRATATAVAETWTRDGGTVLRTVDWPKQAASWLKPARQLVRSHPDAWVIIDNPAGCAQLAMRLIELEGWSPFRTFGTASLDSLDARLLTGFGVLTGMRGVSQDGATWHLGYGVLSRHTSIATP